ncbi:MAG TPA: hypothetical protein VNG90_04810 [Candidatus Acidoferrum sp.]|nr:hypothetical protein [Candidatus Acidoferrum sp.]
MLAKFAQPLQCAVCDTIQGVSPVSRDTAFVHCQICAREVGQYLKCVSESGVVVPNTVSRPEELGGSHSLAYRIWRTSPLTHRVIKAYQKGLLTDETARALCKLAIADLEPVIQKFAGDNWAHFGLVRALKNAKIQCTMSDNSRMLIVPSQTTSNVTLRHGRASLTVTGKAGGYEDFHFTLEQLELLLAKAQEVLSSLARI